MRIEYFSICVSFNFFFHHCLILLSVHSLHMFPRPLYPRSWGSRWPRQGTGGGHRSPHFSRVLLGLQQGGILSLVPVLQKGQCSQLVLSSLGSQVLAIPSPCLFCPILGCRSLQFLWLPECFTTPVWHFNSPHTLGKEIYLSFFIWE